MASPTREMAPAGPVLHGAGQQLGGFRKFILRGNVVDLAVGLVVGAAFGSMVQALVRDLLTPLLGLFGGVPDLAAWTVEVRGSRFLIGDFLNALVSFLLIAAVVYVFVVLPVNKLMDRYRPEAPPAPTKACPECTSRIPQLDFGPFRPRSRRPRPEGRGTERADSPSPPAIRVMANCSRPTAAGGRRPAHQ